jgi:hypothetical protein
VASRLQAAKRLQEPVQPADAARVATSGSQETRDAAMETEQLLSLMRDEKVLAPARLGHWRPAGSRSGGAEAPQLLGQVRSVEDPLLAEVGGDRPAIDLAQRVEALVRAERQQLRGHRIDHSCR